MAGGMFGKFPVLLIPPCFSTSHDCSRGHRVVCSLVLWPIRCHSTGVSHGISGFPSCGSSMCHPAVVRFIPRYSLSPIDNLTGSSLIVPSFLLLLTQRRQIRLLNGLMLSTSISTHSSRFILPSMLLNFSSSPSF